MSFGTVIFGLLVMGAGTAMTLKSEWLLQNFGSVQWAEEHLGSSRLFYKLLGAFIAFVGILVTTGLWQGIVLGTVGRLFVPPTPR